MDFIPSLSSTNVKIKKENLISHGITTSTLVGSSGFAVRFIPLKCRDSTYRILYFWKENWRPEDYTKSLNVFWMC